MQRRSLLSSLTITLALAGALTLAGRAAQGMTSDEVHSPDSRSFAYAMIGAESRTPSASRAPLGSISPQVSPGVTVGQTWLDYQQNGSMGRMIYTDTGGFGDDVVHFIWTYLPGASRNDMEGRYRVYNMTTQTMSPAVSLPRDDYQQGFVNGSYAYGDYVIVGGNLEHPTSGFTDSHFWVDYGETGLFFGLDFSIPRILQEYPNEPGQQVLWPRFEIVEGTNDTVLHVLAMVGDDNVIDASSPDPRALYYFRATAGNVQGAYSWDSPPVVLDTIYTPGYDIAADDFGNLALTWIANLPCSPGDHDSMSGYECFDNPECQNDVYYQQSFDYGVTFDPRVNLTQYRYDVGRSYRAFTDISALLDTDLSLHIVWNARPLAADACGDTLPCGGQGSRIFHWSEALGLISTVHDAEWDAACDGGTWQLNTAKLSLSECNGRFYVLFTQFNDAPGGILSDCADGYETGAANGELYVAISSDGGVTWDEARNLTNTRSPDCIDDCASENWPAMAPYGTNKALAAGDNITDVIVPAGGTDNGWYLDVQYIEDISAGASVQGEGTWQQANLRWFRLACVEPTPDPQLVIHPEPTGLCVPHGEELVLNIVLENIGNVTLNYTPTTEEDFGPAGWFTTAGMSGVVGAGLSNTETFTLTINPGGTIDNSGQPEYLQGRIIFTHNGSTSPDTLDITAVVSDSCCDPCCPDSVRTVDTILAGRQDNFSTADGVEPSEPGPDIIDEIDCSLGPLVCNAGTDSEFDCDGTDRCFGHTFTDIVDSGACVTNAKLCFKITTSGGDPTTDNIGIWDEGMRLWSKRIGKTIQAVTGGSDDVWNLGDTAEICLDLANLPFGGTNSQSYVLHALQDGTFDIRIRDDTKVDYLQLVVEICGDCCDGLRGDVNGDGQVNVSDLSYLVDYLFKVGEPPPCFDEADVNASGSINVSDLSYLVDFLFKGGPPPLEC